MTRHAIAYLIIAAMIAVIFGLAAFRWHHGRARTLQRRKAREESAYRKRMAEKAAEEER